MVIHARIQKIFSGGTNQLPTVIVPKILPLQKPIFWKIEGGGLDPYPPSGSAHVIAPLSQKQIKTKMLRSISCQVSQSKVKRLASIVTSANESTCNFGNTMLQFSRDVAYILSSDLEFPAVKHVHIICHMLSFPSTLLYMWRIESIKGKKWGCILSMWRIRMNAIWILRTYVFLTYLWDIGMKSVTYCYQFFTRGEERREIYEVWNLRVNKASLKFVNVIFTSQAY